MVEFFIEVAVGLCERLEGGVFGCVGLSEALCGVDEGGVISWVRVGGVSKFGFAGLCVDLVLKGVLF